MPDQPKWAVAVAAPQQVEKVVEQLPAHQIPYFFPRVKTMVRHRGKRVASFRPLLFNYIPICLVPGWQAIFSLRGTHSARGVLDVIGPLAACDVERLRAACGSDGVYTHKPVARFKPGQRVKAATGPFEGIVGRFESAEDEAAKVLIHSFGRLVSIKFEVGNLVAA
jgi:transcription antitermination factor NusG